MARYSDHTLCPDCGATLPVDPASCPRCDLPLRGPLAISLHHTLVRADALLTQLRAEGMQAAPASAPTAAVRRRGSATGATDPRRTGLSGASVPRILLGLGALCLLVAAVAFLAVAWSWLGLGGRTAVLVLATVAVGGAGAALARRGLRVGAEALSTVALGLLALDVVGAAGAGWLGDGGDGDTTALAVGVALLAGSLVLLALAPVDGGGDDRHDVSESPLQRVSPAGLVAPQLVAALGLALATAAVLALSDVGSVTTTVAATGETTLGVLAGLALAALGRHLGLRPLAFAGLVDALLWWATLTVLGLGDAVTAPALADLWGRGSGLGLAAAAVLALVVGGSGLVPLPRELRLARPARVAASAAGAALLTLLVALPGLSAGTTATTLTCLAGAGLWTLVALTAPAAWRVAAAAPQLLLGLPLVGIGADLARTALDDLAAVGDPSTQDLGVRLAATDPVTAAWLLVPTAVVVAAAVTAQLVPTLPGMFSAPSLPVATAAVGAGAGLLAAPVALAAYPVPLAVVVAAAGVLGTAALLGGLQHQDVGGTVGTLLGALVWLGALVAALPSPVLTTAALAVAVALAGLVLARGRFRGASDAAATALPLLAGALAWSAADALGVAEPDRALGVLVVVGLLAVARPRVGTEVAAALTALVATTAALTSTLASTTGGTDALSTPLAVHLTLAGALVTASALLHPTRRVLGWPGGLLLAAATWVRLADLGVSAPEAYTLPTALALVALALVRLHRDGSSSTLRTMTPGLTLATVPSLLWVLDDPVSLRAVLLGAACLGMLLVGLVLRWSAPVVVGAAVGGVLVLTELAPYAAVTPQWVLVGLAGTVLVLVGVTWEQRMADLRRTSLRLARLR